MSDDSTPAASPPPPAWAAPSPWAVPDSVPVPAPAPAPEPRPHAPVPPPPSYEPPPWAATPPPPLLFPPLHPPPAPAAGGVVLEPAPGGGFALALLPVRPIRSGLAVGSLVAGIGALVVTVAVCCFGAVGSDAGWGPWVAGAFTLLGTLAGLAGVGLGLVALRQIRRSGGDLVGRGVAIAGLSCGGVGAVLVVGSFVLALLLKLSTPA